MGSRFLKCSYGLILAQGHHTKQGLSHERLYIIQGVLCSHGFSLPLGYLEAHFQSKNGER
jgi:hypothetical protein